MCVWSNLTGYGLNDGFVFGCFPVASLVPWDSNSIFIQDFVFVFFSDVIIKGR